MARKSASSVAVSATTTTALPRGTKPALASRTEADEQYDVFENKVRMAVGKLTGPLFTTDIDPDVLWNLYLDNLPSNRQHYVCNGCRRFIQRYTGLVSIDEAGNPTPAIWGQISAPKFFAEAVDAMYCAVGKAKVNGVFLPTEAVWGQPKDGQWTHLSGRYTGELAVQKGLTTPDQQMAQLKEDFGMIQRALANYSADIAGQALRFLKSDTLARSEKALGVAQWFVDLHANVAGATKRNRDNVIWLAAATAPVGFAHVNAGLISTLLDDLLAGLPHADIKRKWAEKVDGINYMRPKAAPKAGTIARAEALVEEMGLKRSLDRRFATLDDVLKKDWEPRTIKPRKPAPTGGVFGHLQPPSASKAVHNRDISGGTMTWAKFERTVLPEALSIEISCPASGNYFGTTTATYRTAPPLLQWDGLDGQERNPVSMYVYHGGSTARQWGLSPGWNKVTAIFRGPQAWQRPDLFKNQGTGIHFSIEGCRDSRNAGLAIFPETLRSELHEVRAVIEAHSKSGTLKHPEKGTANGLAFSANTQLRVTTADGRATYVIDRMD